MNKSGRMKARLKAALYFKDRMERSLECWRLSKDKIEYTEAQRQKMRDAFQLMCQAERVVKEVYAEMIGKAVVDEIG